jgi:hypothetical protein
MTQHDVAMTTEDAANSASDMIVVYVHSSVLEGRIGSPTHDARSTLRL